MSSALAAADSAAMLIFRVCRSHGFICGRNSSVWLPTARPVVSADVALASHEMEETCCDFRPGFVVRSVS